MGWFTKKSVAFGASISLLFTSLLFFSTASFAQTTTDAELEYLLEHLSQTEPDIAKQYEAEKKKFEKWERDLGKKADDITKTHMDKVFGEGKLKSSDVLGYLKAGEAALAGDYDKAGEALLGVLVTCPPNLFGCYLTAMKEVKAQIATQIHRWEEEIYVTQSYKYFRYDFDHLTTIEQMTSNRDDYREFLKYQAYVPSYMINYLRNDPNIGDEMEVIYDEMVVREKLIRNTWAGDAGGRLVSVTPAEKKFNSTMTRENAFAELMWGKGWSNGTQNLPWWQFSSTGDIASKWRSRLGFAPGDRDGQDAKSAIFNHFLYTVTEPKRDDYMSDLVEVYIQPLINEEAKKQKTKTNSAIAEALMMSIIEMRNASEEAPADGTESAYRKYLYDGLKNRSILLPADTMPDTAHALGMQAVAGGKSYRSLITDLHSRALKERALIAAAAEAKRIEEESQEHAGDEFPVTPDMPGGIIAPPIDDGSNITEDESESSPTTVQGLTSATDSASRQPPMVGRERRNCLLSIDFSSHEHADVLALLPEYLKSDFLGFLNKENGGADELLFLLKLVDDACRPIFDETVAIAEPDGLVDEWGDVDEVDSLIVSSMSEDEKWAKRDELAAKSQQDMARSEDRFSRQYANVEARREEEERIARRKAAERAEAFAALAQGLTDISSQLQETDQRDRVAAQQNAQSYDTRGLQRQSQDRLNFVKSCVHKKATTPGFPSLDPVGDGIICGQEYDSRQSGTSGDGSSYAEKLTRQQQQTAQRRADEASRLVENREAALKAARDREYAKKRCGCYRAGKRAGASVPSGESINYSEIDPRPVDCVPMRGMGASPPWRLGLFDGWQRKSDKRAEEICRFGT